MIALGITGRSGCGKSTVTAVFSAHGVPLADADQISREILLPGSPLLPRLAQRFGADILKADGTLDRRLLADRAFATPEGKAALDSLTHPEIVRRIRAAKQAAQDAGAPLFVLDGAVIVGTAAQAECDRLCVVTAPFETSVARIVARDVGFDRSMVGGYGHDDRVDAYPALMAEIETKDPVHTTVCVLTDKEEIGSDGVTGMQSMYVFHFMQLLCRAAGQDDILAFQNSVCLSADVTAAYDPSWANAFEPQNGTYAGRGVAFFKYTGSRGKSSASDASAELVGDITCLLDANGVAWQIGELGRLDLGGGGTIAKYVANRGIPVLDIGVPVLSMHSPFEVIHKTDLYMAYRTFSLFCQNAE